MQNQNNNQTETKPLRGNQITLEQSKAMAIKLKQYKEENNLNYEQMAGVIGNICPPSIAQHVNGIKNIGKKNYDKYMEFFTNLDEAVQVRKKQSSIAYQNIKPEHAQKLKVTPVQHNGSDLLYSKCGEKPITNAPQWLIDREFTKWQCRGCVGRVK